MLGTLGKIRGKMLLMLLSVVLVFLLNGCSTGSTTVYRYSPPTSPDGRACVDECHQTKKMCKNLCQQEDPMCVNNEQARAKQQYQDYVAEKNAQGMPASRTIDSFYNGDICAHTGCGCDHEYEVCYQLCGTRTEIHDHLATD